LLHRVDEVPVLQADVLPFDVLEGPAEHHLGEAYYLVHELGLGAVLLRDHVLQYLMKPSVIARDLTPRPALVKSD